MQARNGVLVLLLIPFAAVLLPQLYDGIHPRLDGVPFFIWYQFAWTIVTAALTIFVYRVRTNADRAEARAESREETH